MPHNIDQESAPQIEKQKVTWQSELQIRADESEAIAKWHEAHAAHAYLTAHGKDTITNFAWTMKAQAHEESAKLIRQRSRLLYGQAAREGDGTDG